MDSFIPLCCFSFRVLVLHMLARCHGLLTWTLEQKRAFSCYDNAKISAVKFDFVLTKNVPHQMPRLAYIK